MSELPGLKEERKRVIGTHSSNVGLATLIGLATGMDVWGALRPANPRADFGMPRTTKVTVNYRRGPGKKRGRKWATD